MGANSHYPILNRLLLLYLLLHLELLMGQGVECIDSIQKGVVCELCLVGNHTDQVVLAVVGIVLLEYDVDGSSRICIPGLFRR